MKNILKSLATASLAIGLPLAAQAQMASVSTTNISATGVNIVSASVSAPSTTLYVKNDGHTRLVIKNGGTSTTATIKTNGSRVCPAGYGCYTPSDVTVSVPANATVEAGPFPKSQYNIAGYDTVRVDFSNITTVSVTALREGRQ